MSEIDFPYIFHGKLAELIGDKDIPHWIQVPIPGAEVYRTLEDGQWVDTPQLTTIENPEWLKLAEIANAETQKITGDYSIRYDTPSAPTSGGGGFLQDIFNTLAPPVENTLSTIGKAAGDAAPIAIPALGAVLAAAVGGEALAAPMLTGSAGAEAGVMGAAEAADMAAGAGMLSNAGLPAVVPTATEVVGSGIAPVLATQTTGAAPVAGGVAPAVSGAAGAGILSSIGKSITDNPIPAIVGAGLLADTLSGGKTLMGTPPEVSTTSGLPKYSPEQERILKAYTDYYGKLAGDTSLSPYTGTRVAPIDPAILNAENLLNNYSPFLSTNLGGSSLSALLDILSGASGKYMEDVFAKTVEAPMLRNWQEKVVPELSGSFNKRGLLYGSGVEEAKLKEARTIAEALAMGRSDLASRMESQRLSGVTAARDLGGLTLSELSTMAPVLANIGGQKQTISQNQANAEYEAWLRNQPGTRPQDAVLASILGLSPFFEPTTVVSGGQEGVLGSLLKAAGYYYGGKR